MLIVAGVTLALWAPFVLGGAMLAFRRGRVAEDMTAPPEDEAGDPWLAARRRATILGILNAAVGVLCLCLALACIAALHGKRMLPWQVEGGWTFGWVLLSQYVLCAAYAVLMLATGILFFCDAP